MIVGVMHRISRLSANACVYVTEHGDTDPGLKLGKPLFLSQRKVKDATKDFYAGVYQRITPDILMRTGFLD